MPEPTDPDLVTIVARTTPAPEFDQLLTRARRRRRRTIASGVGALALVLGGAAAVTAVAGSSSGALRPTGPSQTSGPVGSPHPVDRPCVTAACLGLPPGARDITTTRADFDGDSRLDTFVVYAVAATRPPGQVGAIATSWFAQIDLASGHHIAVELHTVGTAGVTGVQGAVDMNRDGRAEAFVRLQAGAANDFYAIYGLADDRIQPVRQSNGRPLSLDLGGSVDGGAGATCGSSDGPPTFETQSYGFDSSHPHARGAWGRTTYRWDGLRLVETGSQHGLLTHAESQDFISFDCDGFTLPGIPTSS